MTETPLEKSFYFRALGSWILDTRNSLIKNAYVLLVQIMTIFLCAMSFLLYMDLCLVFGDVKRMAWNLCASMLVTESFLKYLCTLHRCDVVNNLRRKLRRNETSRATPDDESLNRSSARELRRIETVFYVTMVIFVPFWLITWYSGLIWGERDIPLPIWLPFEIDYQNDVQFRLLFMSVAAAGIVGLLFAITLELEMFTILIQISREYERLTKDFSKINELYLGGKLKTSREEVNPYLREIKVKRLLKEFTIRQQELIKYTRDFEDIYKYPLLLQFFLVSFLFVLCIILVIMEYDTLSWNMTYLLAYSVITVLDMLGICWFATRLRTQCFRIGEAAYSVLWYQMGIDIQKRIRLIILRSQNPPKITSGKIMEMDLQAFIFLIKNIYSWLTLYNHLAFKLRINK